MLKKIAFILLTFYGSMLTASAENLSNRQLLFETIRYLESYCHDEHVIQTLTQVGEAFDIPDLKTYAQLRQKNVIDTCNRRIIQCVDHLISYSDRTYDTISYESIYLRLISFGFLVKAEDRERRLTEVYPLAETLYARDNNPKNKELWHFSRFLHLIGNDFSCDPTKEYDIAKLLVEIEDFYKDHPRSDIKGRIYAIAGNQMQTFRTKYEAYSRVLGTILEDEGKNSAVLNIAIDTLYLYDTIPIYLYTSHCSKEDHHCYCEMHKDCPEDIIMSRITYLSQSQLWENNTDILIPYLEEQYAQLVSSLGENAPICVYANVYIRQLAVKCKKEAQVPAPDKESMAAYLLPDGVIPYIRFLYSLADLEVTNTIALRGLCREMRQLAETHLSKYPARRLSACLGEAFLQRQKAFGYEMAFTKLLFDFEMQCRSKASWELIDVGKDLTKLAVDVFSRKEDALRIEYDILQMVQHLTSDTSLIFKSEYGTYLNVAISSYPLEPKDLDGQIGIEHLIESVEKATANTMLQVPLKWLIVSFYQLIGELDKSAELSRQLVEDISQIRKQTQNPNYLIDTELEAYATWIMCSSKMSDKERKKHIQKLEKLYFSRPECVRFAPVNALATYYSTLREWDKAMRVVDFALEQLDAMGHNLWDGFYVQLSQAKVNILINSKADIDQCRQMTERLNQDIQKIKEIGNYGVYLTLLQTMCQLTNITSPNDIIHYKYLRLMYEKALEFYETSGQSDQVKYTFLLTAYTAICQTLFYNWEGNHPTEYYLLLYTIEHEVLPNLLQMEERFRQVFPDKYTESSSYVLMLSDIAMAYDIAYQEEMAEEYISRLAAYMPKDIEMMYMYHYARNNDQGQMQEHMHSFFQDGVDSDRYGTGGKALLSAGKCFDAAGQSDWKKAEQYAWEYYEAIQAYMQQNLLFFTQAETEHLLKVHGVGGMPIQGLAAVPDIKQKKKLIEQSYTINLQQKGLMLRKADRLRQAVEASDDSTLIAAMDSIQELRRELTEVDANQLMVDVDDEAIEKRERLFTLERFIARATQHLMTEEKQITWRDVRDHLHPGEAAVEYVVYPQLMYALVLTPKCKTPQYVALPRGLEGMQYANEILTDTLLTDFQKTEKLYGEESMLYDAFWQPLENSFEDARTIYFSPTGPLNLICFHALRINTSSYLTDQYDLHQLTSTALLAERDKHAIGISANHNAKVYGAIYYNENQVLTERQLAHMRETYTFVSEPLLATNRNVLGEVFPFLENTLYEADGIHHTLTTMGVNSAEEIGFTPSESTIRNLSGHSPEILHISTHGFFYSSLEETKMIPYFQKGGELNAMTCSGLALANADDAWLGLTDADSHADNILTSAEVSELDLRNTKLVVLSACQTGLGNVGADGVFGLQRGFKQAGVGSICASLWSVADKATAEMMQLFYKYWISEHMTLYKAMKRAMQEQRTQTPTPYYWASFILLDAIE